MYSVHIRQQGGAAIMTIPADVLKAMDLRVGSSVTLNISNQNDLIIRAQAPRKKRFSLNEILEGVTPKTLKEMRKNMAWAEEGDAVGREL